MRIGKYEIEGELGHGSMGVVYRARDTLLDRYVAVKLVSTSTLDDWSRTLFEREAKAVARMSHPNIIVVHDFDYFENQPYIVMELLKGKDLEELAYNERLPVLTVLDCTYQVLNGLEHAHQQGVIHRDIKPTNIFVTESKVVKIMDFGIARLAASASTATQGFVLGTPEYMSPEQVKAEDLDGRTDLFSVGTMMYWLLSGETPFSGDTANSTMYKVVNDEPPPLQIRGIRAQVHESIQTILNRALAKDPADRYPSAGEMAKDLRKLIIQMEQEPELEPEDPDLDNAETVQVPIRKFTTVKKTTRGERSLKLKPETSIKMESPPRIPTVVEPKVADARTPTIAEPPPSVEIERTMYLGGSKEKMPTSPHVSVPVLPTQAVRRLSKRNIAIALILLLAAAWGIYRVIVARMIPEKIPPPAVSPLVELNIACSSEKIRWAEHFIHRFSQTLTGKNVQLKLIPELSAVSDEGIFSKEKNFQIWWPSSELEAQLIGANHKQVLAGNHQAIGLTPMVLLMWKDRYDAFVSKYKAVDFTTIQRALLQESGWKTIAGKPEWGRFTFVYTEPRITNSGTLLLLLMTHEYLKKDSALTASDIQDPGLKTFLSSIKQKGKSLKSSTTELMEEMIRKGPGSFDVVFVYENLALDYLTDAQDRWGKYQVVYPIYNYWNENPLYVLNSGSISSEQKKAAERFRAFLLQEAMQKDSLEHGVRPAMTSIPVRVEGSPLVLNQDLGFRVDIGTEIEDSSPDVIRSLLDLWDEL